MLGQQNKNCVGCGLQPIANFYHRYDKPHLLQSRCKKCEILKNKAWCKSNASYRKEYKRLYEANRLATDIDFKLQKGLRARINRAVKQNYKAGSAIKDLGCSVEFLKTYLEFKFEPGMTWENWATLGWHIDHIIPLSSFDLSNPEELKRACHYTNLQPLWWQDNTLKGDIINK